MSYFFDIIIKKGVIMKPSDVRVRILVKNYQLMYDFYKDIMGYEVFWGDRNGTYASFNIPGEAFPAFAIYVKNGYSLYNGYHDIGEGKADHIVMCHNCDDVDQYYSYLLSKGLTFIGEPRDIPEWYCRVVLMRDPEDNLIDISGPLKNQGI
jgi:predicted enzyme related to lactoylglutathione lyase